VLFGGGCAILLGHRGSRGSYAGILAFVALVGLLTIGGSLVLFFKPTTGQTINYRRFNEKSAKESNEDELL
jgi:hypothetical protein